MDFTCWKWQDISVANTISMTRARSSLKGQTEKRSAPTALLGGPRGRKSLVGMPTPGFCSHKLILGEVDENVHLIILHHSENRAEVVILQHRAVIVQDGTF